MHIYDQLFHSFVLGLISEMDKSIAVLEENRGRNNSSASASNSFGSFVQINSIAVDLSIPVEEIEIPAHGHFSIR